MTLTIGLDVGTQGIKGVVLDPAQSPSIIARATLPLSLLTGLPAGAAEQNPEDWWQGVVTVIQALLESDAVEPSAIDAIGVSGQQHGSVFLDAKDSVVRPAKLWCDTSTHREAQALSERLGRAIPVGFTASKVAWLAANEPDAWQRTTGVLLPHDFINLRLTGRRVTEAGDASGTGYFDPTTRDWDSVAARETATDLLERLPPLIEAGESIGPLEPRVAQELGLSPTVLVSTGGGDNMMSAIGAGATRSGIVVVSLGTSATVFTRTDTPVVDPEGVIAPFCSSDGAWLPLLCTMNCTNVTEEVRAAFGLDSDRALAQLTEEATALPAGAQGVTFIPFLQGERVPDLPLATGTIEGLRPGLLRPATLFRAALEGVTSNLALGVERLRALGVAVDRVHLVGGGSKNALWRTLVADLLGAQVALPLEPESGALGAAIQALWTVRRLDQPSLTADDIAAPLVETAPECIDPDGDRRVALLSVLEHYRARIAALSPR